MYSGDLLAGQLGSWAISPMDRNEVYRNRRGEYFRAVSNMNHLILICGVTKSEA
jgi:hypothetical protein